MTRPRLYLIRHGETDWNAEGRLLSFTDRPLNDRGERQAATLAGDLAGICWDRAVSPSCGGDRIGFQFCLRPALVGAEVHLAQAVVDRERWRVLASRKHDLRRPPGAHER
jgi:hypothetical protein